MIRLPHLETNVTVACQNRCVSCNHFVPVQTHRIKESMLDPAVLERDMHHFGRVAHSDAWAAIGGEPLMHPKLVELLRVVRASGVADILEVWTNGQDLPKMANNFWESFDRLVVSVYPGFDDERLKWIKITSEMMGVELRIIDERHRPNFTRLLAPTDDAQRVARRYRDCWFKTYSRVLDNGYFYRCCTSPFIPALLQGKQWGTDGLKVDESLTVERLQSFLEQVIVPSSCWSCAGRSTEDAVPVQWREIPDPKEWLVASGAA